MSRILASLAALLLATACVSFLPQPEAPGALYRIGPVETHASLPPGAIVVIRRPEAPRVLAGTEMVARDGSGAIRFVDGVEWADGLTRLLQLALLDALSTGGGGLAVLPESGARPDYDLVWRVMEFSLRGDRAEVRLELTLLDARSRAPVFQDRLATGVDASSSQNRDRAGALADAGRLAVREAADVLARRVGEVQPGTQE